MNQPLATAYYLKEELRLLWREATSKTARQGLQDWINQAEVSGMRELVKMAATLRRYRKEMLAYFRVGITSGPMEGMNNKIKVLLRKTYGLRDEEYFILRLKALHRSKWDIRLEL
jgi:transposase